MTLQPVASEETPVLWDRLVQPLPSVTDEEQIIRARLIAGIVITILALGLPVIVYYLIRPSSRFAPDTLSALASWLLGWMAYFAARRGRTDLAGVLMLGLPFLIFVVSPFLPGASNVLALYSGIVLLLTAMLFRTRHVIAVAVLVVVTALLLITFVPQRDTDLATNTVIRLAILILLTTGALAAFIDHNRRLEAVRRHQLESANQRLRDSESRLEERVRERTLELVTARDAAERANRVKSQFLASMSHELRTPLNAILNFTELTAMGVAGPVNDQQRELLARSLDSGRHLLNLINDVLDISKMQSETLSLFIEDDIDLRAELRAVIDATEGMLKDKPVTLDVLLPEHIAPLRGDRRRIRQVLLNLLSNAAKFTEAGGISIVLTQTPDETRIVVHDSGPGIPPDKLDLIFQPFIQTETGIRHAGGTGLGLPISRHLVEAHGGRLWAESVLGEGASFIFTLPRAGL